MSIRKKDFQRVVHDLKDFLSKLSGNDTAELRDAINFSLLHLHKYYKRLRHKTKAAPLLDGSLSLSSSLGSLSPASPFIPPANKFEWKWINLDSAQLSASFGHGEHRNLLPEIFYVLKDADVERLQEMVQKDTDCINEVDALGRTTTAYCLHGKTEEHLKCLDILIQYGVDLQQESNDGQAPIHIAVLCNNENGLDRLLAKKVNVNVEDNEGRYPMHLAAGYSSPTVIKKLLAAGGDKETLDNDEMTPVMWACYFDNYENVETLLNISVDDEMRYEIIDAEIQDKDVNGKSLLHWSVAHASSKQCFKIIFNPEYATLTDSTEKTVLHDIAENGAVGALEEYLALCELNDLDIADQEGRTPLHLACLSGHGEIVDIFLNRGASLDVIDDTGKTPFDYAKSKNLNYCLLVILSHIKFRQKTDGGNGEKLNANGTGSLSNGKTRNATATPTSKTNSTLINKNLKNSQTTQGIVKNQNKISSQIQEDEKSRNTSNIQGRLLNVSYNVDNETRMRCDSDVSTFDTPQDESHGVRYKKPSEQRRVQHSTDNYSDNKKDGNYTKVRKDNDNYTNDNKSDDDISADDDDDDYNFNDQLVVLVEHQGSDDELVIDVDSMGDGNIESGDVNVDEPDQDLFDVTTFARNGSITSAGVVSEGNIAYNSASANHSVSSLDNSDGCGDEKDANQQQLLVNQRRGPKDGRNPLQQGNTMTSKRGQFKDQRSGSQDNSRKAPKPQVSNYSPRSMSSHSGGIDMNSPMSSFIAPIPPPSQYYAGGGGNSEVLVIHDDEEPEQQTDELPPFRRDDVQMNEARPKTSKGRRKSRSQMEQSWPPPTSQEENHDIDQSNDGGKNPLRHSAPTRSSTSVRLAPLSPVALPKPPSYKF